MLARARSRWASGAAMTAALLAFGVLTTPGFFQAGWSWLGFPAVVAILTAYAFAGVFVAPVLARREPEVPYSGTLPGLIAGGVYAAEILLEYALRPVDNTAWGIVEFGLVFALIAVAGARAGWRTGRFWPAALAGAWTAMTASLVWYLVALAVFLAFRGTFWQDMVLRAEGDVEDFYRSGMTDYRLFVMQDFVGAGFYHLLLSPVFGVVLASLGAVPAVVARRLRGARA